MVAATSLVPLLLGACMASAVIAPTPVVGPTPRTGAEIFLFGDYKEQLHLDVQNQDPGYIRGLMADPVFPTMHPKLFASLKQLQPTPLTDGVGSPVSPAQAFVELELQQQPAPPSVEIGSPVSPASVNGGPLMFPMGKYKDRLVSEIEQEVPGYAARLEARCVHSAATPPVIGNNLLLDLSNLDCTTDEARGRPTFSDLPTLLRIAPPLTTPFKRTRSIRQSALRQSQGRIPKECPDCRKLRNFDNTARRLRDLQSPKTAGSPTQRTLFNMPDWSKPHVEPVPPVEARSVHSAATPPAIGNNLLLDLSNLAFTTGEARGRTPVSTLLRGASRTAPPSVEIASPVSPASVDDGSLMFPMGKYKGRLVSEIEQEVPGYAANLLKSNTPKLFKQYRYLCRKLRSVDNAARRLRALRSPKTAGSPTQRTLFNMPDWSKPHVEPVPPVEARSVHSAATPPVIGNSLLSNLTRTTGEARGRTPVSTLLRGASPPITPFKRPRSTTPPGAKKVSTLHPEPYNLNPKPHTLNPEPQGLNPNPQILNPKC